MFNESKKAAEDYNKKLSEIKDKFKELKDSATKDIKDINLQLSAV